MYYVWLLIKAILYIPYRLIFPTRVINKRELRKHRGKGVVFVCNHRSNFDPPLIFILINRRLNFLVKPELMENKFLAAMAFGPLGCYPVGKGNDLALIRHSLSKLKKKQAMFIFPEGRRVFNPEDALALRSGAAMIAIKAGVPIVPMVFKRAPKPFVFNALKIGEAISTEQYQNKRLEKADLSDLSGKIQAAMGGLLNGFEHKPKQKWWNTEPSNVSRGIVIVDENKLLVMKRVRDGQTYYVTPGGHIEEKENPRDTVVREIKEETNIDVEPIRLLYKNKRFNNFRNTDEMQSFYYCNYLKGTVSITDAEEYTRDTEFGTYEPMLIDIAELKNIDFRPACIKEQLLKDIKKYGTKLTRPTKYIK